MTVDTQSKPQRRERVGKPTPPADGAASPVTPSPPRLPGRRNPRWIALGVVAICLGGLLSYLVYARIATETAVVAVAQTVNRGETIEAADLTTTTLSGGSRLSTVSASDLDDLVGRRVSHDLVQGALVPAAALTETAVPAEGQSVVGLKLSQGRVPADLLPTGSTLRLVILPTPSNAANARDAYAGRTYFATLVSSAAAADGTSTLVNVEVAANFAPVVASLAAQDRVAALRDTDR